MKAVVISVLVAAILAVAAAEPPPHVEEKIKHVADFINGFSGSRADLEKAIMANFSKEHDEMPAHVTKEMVEKFIDSVAAKITSKVMSGEDFKKFAAEQMAKKGGM